MTNSVMASSLPKVRSGWMGAYVLSIFVFIGVAWVYVYSMMQVGRYNGLIAQEQEKITALQNDITTAQKDERYLKYVAAKEIVANNPVVWWWDRISRVMNVFTKLQQLWGANIRFSDFSIDYESLSLKWTVSDLKLIYGKWWVIDMFNELDFLQKISVPWYRKTDDWFEFSLAAQVILNNVSN